MRIQPKKLIIIGVVLFFLIVLVVIVLHPKNNQGTTIQTQPNPTILTTTKNIKTLKPVSIKNVPKTAGSSSSAVDPNSILVKTSEQQINTLARSLPYQKDIPLENGLTISIVVPSLNYQDGNWYLLAQIFGVDYNVTPSDPAYTKNKNAFLLGANEVLTWVKNQGSDPTKMIIVWGDKKFIQDKTQEWLANP